MVFLALRFDPYFAKWLGAWGVSLSPCGEYPHGETLNKTDFHKVEIVRVAWTRLQVSIWKSSVCLTSSLVSSSSEDISLLPVASDGFNTFLSWAKFTWFGLSCTYKLLPVWMSGSEKKSYPNLGIVLKTLLQIWTHNSDSPFASTISSDCPNNMPWTDAKPLFRR